MKYIKKFNESSNDDNIDNWSVVDKDKFLENLDDIIQYVNVHEDNFYMFQEDYKNHGDVELSTYFGEYEIYLITNFDKIKAKVQEFELRLKEEFDLEIDYEIKNDNDSYKSILVIWLSSFEENTASNFKLLFDEISFFEETLKSKIAIDLLDNSIYLNVINFSYKDQIS